MGSPTPEIMTIGHSTLSYAAFLSLLRAADISAVVDVRSLPYSRHTPHFNKDALSGELKADGVAYVFLGDELGGRPEKREVYCEGVADYELMAGTTAFEHGLERVVEGTKRYRIALMCSEQDPLDCHRCLLVGRALHDRGISVRHILKDGFAADHAEIEQLLLLQSGDNAGQSDFFSTPGERLANAYRARARRVAFVDSSMGQRPATAAE